MRGAAVLPPARYGTAQPSRRLARALAPDPPAPRASRGRGSARRGRGRRAGGGALAARRLKERVERRGRCRRDGVARARPRRCVTGECRGGGLGLGLTAASASAPALGASLMRPGPPLPRRRCGLGRTRVQRGVPCSCPARPAAALAPEPPGWRSHCPRLPASPPARARR